MKFKHVAILVLLALAVLFLLAGPSVYASESRDGSAGLIKSFRRVSSAVGALYVQTAGGDLNYACTVTVIEHKEERSILITAGHCVDRGEAYMVTFDGRRFYTARVWKLPAEKINPQKKRQYGEPMVDMALFIVDERLSVKPIEIGMKVSVEPGRGVLTVGYPLGVTKIRYNGIIAGRLERPGSKDHGYLLLQIFGAPGSSGSAVVDQRTGLIIGILVSGKQGSAGLPVIYAVPISYKKHLIPAGKKE
ncbi:MAG: serine protease [Nitrospinaceae bacterium]